MIRFVVTASNSSEVQLLKFNIEVDYLEVVDGKINPVLDAGELDSDALDEYLIFVELVKDILSDKGYKIIGFEESPYSDTSKYFTAYRKSESTDMDIKCVWFIRLSDHELSDYAIANHTKYYKHTADDLKQPKSKKRQRWKFKNIVVNGDKYDSYESALTAIKDMLP